MLSLAPLTADLPAPSVVKCWERASLHDVSTWMMEILCLDNVQMIGSIVRAICMHGHCCALDARECDICAKVNEERLREPLDPGCWYILESAV